MALVSPYADDREQARSLFPDGDFAEVWIKTPAEVCAARDPKGLYKKAAAGALPNLTGIGQDYESPVDAELVVDGTRSIEEIIQDLLAEFFN